MGISLNEFARHEATFPVDRCSRRNFGSLDRGGLDRERVAGLVRYRRVVFAGGQSQRPMSVLSGACTQCLLFRFCCFPQVGFGPDGCCKGWC
jgi:hypothetical protein